MPRNQLLQVACLGLFVAACPLSGLAVTVSPDNGPFSGGNTVLITDCVPDIGNGTDITNIAVGAVGTTNITGQGLNWVSFVVPPNTPGIKDIIIQSTSAGDTTFTGAYTVNPAGLIGVPEDWSQWEEVAALPACLEGMAVGVMNDSLYAIGGADGSGMYSNVYRFDGTSWSEVASLPAGRMGMAAGVLNGTLYAMGGGALIPMITSNVYGYNGTSWSEAPVLPAARIGLGAGVLNGVLYAMGGDQNGFPIPMITSNVYGYNETNWFEVPGLPAERVGMGAGVLNGALYCVGGQDSTLAQTNVFRFDGTSWSQVAGLPVPRRGLAGGVLNGALYAIAGKDDSTAQTNVFRYDGISWTNVPGLPAPRERLGAGVLNGALYAIGGFDGSGTWTNTVYRYPGFVSGGSGVTPSSGSYTGGYQVVITGANLGDGVDITNVTLCGVNVMNIFTQSTTQVVVIAGTSPGGGVGNVKVVSTSYGTTIKAKAFTYMPSLSANAGPLAGGNMVTITCPGLGNMDITNVTVGGLMAPLMDQDVSWITITMPAFESAGLKDVVIQSTSVGETKFPDAYTVNPAGQIIGGAIEASTPWQEVAGLPVEREELAVAVLNGSLYAIGGKDASGTYSNVYLYDGTGWAEIVGLPAARHGLSAGVLNGELYAVGGYDEFFAEHTNVYRYDVTQWTEVAGLPDARADFAAGVLNGELYVVGGDRFVVPQTNAYRYNGTNWTEVPGLPEAYSSSAGGDLNGAMYVMGGRTLTPQANVYRYSVGSNWAAAPSLPGARYSSAAARLDGELYLIGGIDDTYSVRTNVFRFNGTNWSEGTGLPAPRSGLAAGALNDAIYAVGGSDGFAQTNVYRLAGSGVNPASGSTNGGYEVVITGSNLGDGYDVTNVTLCGVAVSDIVTQSTTRIVVIAAPSFECPGDVVVCSTSYGTTIRSNAFTYEIYYPDIAVLGTNGAVLVAGEEPTTEAGTDFGHFLVGISWTNVFTMTNAGRGVLHISEWQTNGFNPETFAISGIPATLASGAAQDFTVCFTATSTGRFDVVLDITSDSTNNFGYYQLNLLGSVFQISTNSGPLAGSNTITILGWAITPGNITEVTVGGVTAKVVEVNDGWVTITVPAMDSSGLKDIVLQIVDVGTITLRDAYTVNPAGIIGSIISLEEWEEVAGLPEARAGLAAGVLNGSLYVIGGRDSYDAQTNVYKYNGTNWEEVAGLPAERGGLTVGVLNGSLYAIGGDDNGWNAQANVYKYDGTSWEEVAGLPEARAGMASAVLDGSLYVIGGMLGGSPQTNVYRYNGASWEEVAGFPVEPAGMAAGVLDGVLYALGGTNNLYRYEDTSWTEVASLPEEGMGMAAGVLNGALYVVGGMDTNVWRYDGVNWTEAAALPTPREALAVGVMDGSLYAIGGWTGLGPATNVYRSSCTLIGPGVVPSSGSYSGGYQIVIAGWNLGDGGDVTNVTLCGKPVSDIVTHSPTQIVVIAGSANPGYGDVVVYSTAFGVTIATNAFLYNPAITVVAGPYGAVTPSGVVDVVYGGTTNFVVSADTYYHIANFATNGAVIKAATNQSVYTSVWVNVTTTGMLAAAFAENLATNATPEWWLATNGWTESFDVAATNDADGDGVPTWLEYWADTVPTNDLSLLRVTNIVFDSGNARVGWSGGQQVWQYLEAATNLLGTGTTWTVIWSNAPPNETSTNVTDLSATSEIQFYRIRSHR